ncbi:hypothetical protein KIL84_010044, partial [Mauremys mutica]
HETSKLLRHTETKHPALKDKPLEFFKRKKREHEEQKQLLKATTSSNVSALKASFLVANRIAKAKKPFTIGEELILPAAKDICRELLGEAVVQKVAPVPLSASTITRRIDEIAEDIEAQLLERVNESPWYAIQVDESTDVDNKATMLVFVRYIFQKDVHEDMLCALFLPTNTTAAELFKSLNDYMSGKLNWSFCVSICTDGAAAMTGRLSGFTTRVKEVASESEILKETEPGPSFSQLVHDHLSQLSKEFEHYFLTTKDPRTGKEWIRDPFVNKPGESTLSVLEEDQLLEITNDGGLKSMFETTSNLHTFWIKVKAEYPEISTKALKSLLPFSTSYLCEAGFSAVTAIKMRLRSRLDISNTLRVSLSPITPRWDRLVAGKQAQGSH